MKAGRSTTLSSYYAARVMLATVFGVGLVLYLLWTYQPVLTLVALATVATIVVAVLIATRNRRTR